MSNEKIKTLEHKVNDLILLCEQMSQENYALKEQKLLWEEERQQLNNKSEMARKHVESIIVHLKTMEQSS